VERLRGIDGIRRSESISGRSGLAVSGVASARGWGGGSTKLSWLASCVAAIAAIEKAKMARQSAKRARRPGSTCASTSRLVSPGAKKDDQSSEPKKKPETLPSESQTENMLLASAWRRRDLGSHLGRISGRISARTWRDLGCALVGEDVSGDASAMRLLVRRRHVHHERPRGSLQRVEEEVGRPEGGDRDPQSRRVVAPTLREGRLELTVQQLPQLRGRERVGGARAGLGECRLGEEGGIVGVAEE